MVKATHPFQSFTLRDTNTLVSPLKLCIFPGHWKPVPLSGERREEVWFTPAHALYDGPRLLSHCWPLTDFKEVHNKHKPVHGVLFQLGRRGLIEAWKEKPRRGLPLPENMGSKDCEVRVGAQGQNGPALVHAKALAAFCPPLHTLSLGLRAANQHLPTGR